MNGGSIWMVLLLVASVMAGCGKEGNPEYGTDQKSPLRFRTDAARNRFWVLGVEDVRVYDATKKQLTRKIVLPNWAVARFICSPDMVLDSSGSAIISSNVQAKLWRVDADSFEVTEHEISLHGREQWDNGFGALAFAADGTLLALTSSGGSLWRIDAGKGSARIVDPNAPLLNTCSLTTQHLNRLKRSQ